MITLNTQGIVLRATRYKENDVILTIFSRKLGKITVLAKGAKRNKSMLLSASQPFSYSNYTLKKQGGMYRIIQSDSIKSFYELSYDMDSFSYATYITKLVETTMVENQTNNRLFVLLAQTLFLLSQEDSNKHFVTRVFELKFMDYIGFRPSLNRCASCGTKDIKPIFNIDEGGVVCEECSKELINNFTLDVTTVKLMEYIISNDILTCSKAKVSKYLVYQLENLLRRYLVNYLDEINFKSLYLLKDLQNNKGVESNEQLYNDGKD